MSEERRRPSFWSTVPRVLTGLAAVITAVGTLVAVVPQLAGTASGTATPVRPSTPIEATEVASGSPPSALCAWFRSLDPVTDGDAVQLELAEQVRRRIDGLSRFNAALRARDDDGARAALEDLRAAGFAPSAIERSLCT
jgi:hypothetical protein